MTEERTQWVEEWVADNEVKTLEECKAWKECTSVLGSPVIGIKVHVGGGCPSCKFSHDRPITGHSCGEVSARIRLVLFYVVKISVCRLHSGEGLSIAERVKSEYAGTL